MKRVLMVCEAFGGGVFTYVSQLCNDMCEEFDVYLAYTRHTYYDDEHHRSFFIFGISYI